MDEYNKINWRDKLLDEDTNFINNDVYQKSYMQKYLDSTLKIADIQQELDRWEQHCKLQHEYPGCKYYLHEKCAMKNRSQFNTVEQLRLISALKVLQSGRVNLNKFELGDRELLNNCKARIQQENAKFLNWAESSWQTEFKKPIRINKKLFDWAMAERHQKMLAILKRGQFYTPVDLLPWCYSTGDIAAEMVHVSNVLDLGCVSKYIQPVLEESHFLDSNLLPTVSRKFYSKLPMSCDKNIDEFIKTGEADVAISLSSLKKIFSYIDTNQLWTIPIVIKSTMKNGQNKKIILFDKPLPKQITNKVDLNVRCHKLLVRSNFCRLEGFSYPNQDKLIGEQSKEMEAEETPERILHNVAYKLWTLKQEEMENSVMHKNRTNKLFKILVRSKIDACTPCEYGLAGVTVVPKLEYQLKFGGAAYSSLEVMSHWTDLTFRPNSIMQRVRTHFLNSEVIKIDSANLASVGLEATQHAIKPQLAFVVFYKLLVGLERYADGSYLLRHSPKDGGFVTLLKSTDDANSLDLFDLHKEYSTKSQFIDPYNKPWTPIDPNVLLPAYDFHGHFPGLYKPCPPVQAKGAVKNNPAMKGIKKKKKKKNKAKNKVINKVVRNVQT